MSRLVMPPPALMPTAGVALTNFAVVLHVLVAISSLALIVGMAFGKKRLSEKQKRKRKTVEEAKAVKMARKQYANDTIAEALKWYNNGNGDGNSGKVSLNQASIKFGVPWSTLSRHHKHPELLGRTSGPQPAIPRDAEDRLIETATQYWKNGMALNNDQMKWFILQVRRSLVALVATSFTNSSFRD